MSRIGSADAASPFGEINTTPLIDVLLVLLVMLIVTIPAATHAVKIDLPAPTTVEPLRASNLITLDAQGIVRWNGSVVDQAQLRQLLATAGQMSAAPELHIRPDSDARHGDVDKLLVLIKQEQIRRFGFVGNERYTHVF